MIHLAFPFHFDAHGRTAISDDAAYLRQLLELLLFTSPGERVNRPDFGGGLRLTDNFKNTYKRVNFGLLAEVKGQIKSESIYPGKTVNDLLVFEVPLKNVQYLRLELPAENIGGSGKLRFQIPQSKIRW